MQFWGRGGVSLKSYQNENYFVENNFFLEIELQTKIRNFIGRVVEDIE